MKLPILLCLILIQPWSTYANFNDWMIFFKEILIYRNAHVVYSFTCFNHKENIAFFKYINNLNLSMSFFNFGFSFDTTLSNELNFIVDLSCANSLNVLNKVTGAGKLNLYQSHHKWLFVDLKSRLFTNISVIPLEIANISIRFDSDILVARPILKNGTSYIALTDLYKTNSRYSTTVKLNDILIWKSNKLTGSKINKYNQRKDLTGTVVMAGLVCSYMEILNATSIDYYYHHVSLKNLDLINKVNYNLFVHIHEMYNFTLQLTIVDKWFGSGPNGGVEAGLGRLLYNDIVDISATSGFITPERIRIFDFVAPTYPFRSSFLFINSETSNNLGNAFVKPFCSSVWYYIIGFVVLFLIILKCILIIEYSTLHSDEDTSWFSAYLLIWAVFCQQGATYIPNIVSGRFTLLTLLLMSLMLYNYYTSSIVSSLLSGLPPPISTIEELTASNLQVGLEDTPYIRTVLNKILYQPRYKNLYSSKLLNNKNKQPLFLSLDEGLSQVQRGGFAYHTESITGYSIIETKFETYEICNLAEITFYHPPPTMVLSRKRGQYKKLLAVGYYKMMQTGIQSRTHSIWINKKPPCFSSTQVVQVGMPYLLSAFLLLMLGGLISIFILIIELLVAQNTRKKLIFKMKT